MKISLAPGQKLTVCFYIPADEKNNSGWAPPQDQEVDGTFLIEHREDGITVSADMEDDSNRGGEDEPIIYRVSSVAEDEGEAEDVDAAEDEDSSGDAVIDALVAIRTEDKDSSGDAVIDALVAIRTEDKDSSGDAVIDALMLVSERRKRPS